MPIDSAEQQSRGGAPPREPELRAGEDSCRISCAAAQPDGGLSSFGDLDRLDRLAMTGLALLLVAALGLLVFQPGQTGQTIKKAGGARQVVEISSPELDKKMATAIALMNGGDTAKAGQLIDALIAGFPYEGGPHMLKGDLFIRTQQPLEAMLEFRQGVDLNPDYLDKKMVKVFQGKKVKSNLEEARLAIEAGLTHSPGDATLREQRKVLYYMLRKVAGSCG